MTSFVWNGPTLTAAAGGAGDVITAKKVANTSGILTFQAASTSPVTSGSLVVTFDNATNIFTKADHGLGPNAIVSFAAATGYILTFGTTGGAGDQYYVKLLDDDTFQIKDARYGAVLGFNIVPPIGDNYIGNVVTATFSYNDSDSQVTMNATGQVVAVGGLTTAGQVVAVGGLTTAGSVDCASLNVAGAPVVSSLSKVYGYAALSAGETITIPSSGAKETRVGTINTFNIGAFTQPNNLMLNTGGGFHIHIRRQGVYRIFYAVMGSLITSNLAANKSWWGKIQVNGVIVTSNQFYDNFQISDGFYYKVVTCEFLGELNTNDIVTFWCQSEGSHGQQNSVDGANKGFWSGYTGPTFYGNPTYVSIHNVD
jgi:hypothetical protein